MLFSRKKGSFSFSNGWLSYEHLPGCSSACMEHAWLLATSTFNIGLASSALYDQLFYWIMSRKRLSKEPTSEVRCLRLMIFVQKKKVITR